MTTPQPPGSIHDRVRRYLSGADLDEPVPADEAFVVRLPEPLPISVRRVATVQLIALGTLVLVVAIALVIAAVAIVIMPFAMGRQGVGMSMVSMFGLCVTAVLTALPLLAIRGAARILRRDARGLAPVNRVAWLTVLLAVPLAFAGALGLDFVSAADVASDALSMQSKLFLVVLAVYFVLALCTILVLHRYRRALGGSGS